MSSLDFTDGIGAVSLSNAFIYPGDRFANWNPRNAVFGERANSLGTGALTIAAFRDDLTVSLEIVGIPNSDMSKMLRLQMHLKRGGAVEINPSDPTIPTFGTCYLAPEADVEIRLTDKPMLEYTLSTVLRGAVVDDLPEVTSCNLALWLKASSLLGTHSQDDAVALWPDSSGNGRDATQAVSTHRPSFSVDGINGGPAVYFNSVRVGADPALLPICLEFGDVFGALTGAEIFVVLKNVLGTPSSDYDSGLWRFGLNGSNWTHYPYTDARVYDGFGTYDRYNTGVFPISPTSPHIYNVTSIAGEWTNRFNGVQLFTSAVNSVGFSATPGLGRSQTTAATSIYNYKGWVSEVIMYDCKLLDADRLAVFQYLVTKYNISVE